MSFHLGGDVQAAGQGLYESSVNPRHALGARISTSDGRVFRYCQVGAVALVAGNAIQSPAPVANHLNLTPSAAAIGDRLVSVTLGATAATAGQYAGGQLIVSTGPGNGIPYRISGHLAAALSTVLIVNLDDAIDVALTTASRIDLMANPYSGVIQTPITTLTGAVAGGAVTALPIATWGWIQTRGTFPGLVDGTPAVGVHVSCPAAVAGGFAVNSGTLDTVGVMRVVGVDTKNKAIELRIE